MGTILVLLLLAFVIKRFFGHIKVVSKIVELVLSTLIALGIMASIVYLAFYATSSAYSKPTEKPAAVKMYEHRMERTLKELDENVFELQKYFIKQEKHDEAEVVIKSKKILDAMDVHYMSITPKIIDEFIEQDEYVWKFFLQKQEEDVEFQKLEIQHKAILNEFQELKRNYPTTK